MLGFSDSAVRGLAPAQSPDKLAQKLAPGSTRVLIATGANDGAYTTEARRFRDMLLARGWPVDYVERPGGHGWRLFNPLQWDTLPTLHRWASAASLTAGSR
jgi:S-formylglutathione hydrolase FrmB